MPEGHSVHRIAKQFEAMFVGSRPEVTSPQGRFATGAAELNRKLMLDARAVGKQLFLGFEGDRWMRVHLGIYGAWDFARASGSAVMRDGDGTAPLDETGEDSLASIGAPRKTRLGQTQMRGSHLHIGEREFREREAEDWAFPPEPVGQVRVRLLTETALADLRGPTACEVLDEAEVLAVLDRLGPDPANDASEAEEARFISRASSKRTPIGLVLMDQSVIAGIGNVYRAEMLFRAGIDPHTPAQSLSREQLEQLWADWAHLLAIGIDVGQMITIDGLEGDAYAEALAKRSARHWVYKREGMPCLRCGTNIALEVMANRKLYWCPGCQH